MASCEHRPPGNFDRRSHKIFGLRRRELLASALATLLVGCKEPLPMPPAPNDPRLPIGDAHVHFFNGADLPVEGFFREVLVPEYFDDWPDVGLALVDIAAWMKQFCTTAAEEFDQIEGGPRKADMSAKDFAGQVIFRAKQARAAPRLATQFRPRIDLGDSYAALARLIAIEDSRYKGAPASALVAMSANLPASSGDEIAINKDALARIAEHGAELLGQGTPAPAFLAEIGLKDVLALIGWAFKMTRSRTTHVRQYLDAMKSDRTRPSLALNLLVDYDSWLNDRPANGSTQPNQVRFWAKFASAHADLLQIETLAGFDPLKHAVQKLSGKADYFRQLTGWALADPAAAERVAGFKLYPPMGFSVWQNGPLPKPELGRGAKIAHDLWLKAGGTPGNFGTRIDEALDDLFAFTAQHDIPVLAHARASNESYEGAGKLALPNYWLARARNKPPQPGSHPVRACLGHFGEELFGSADVREILDLNLAGGSKIYFDIAFDDEILGDPRAADRLLVSIASLCQGGSESDVERRAGYFLFGTDWIMLAQRPGHKGYVDAVDEAIDRSEFWKPLRNQLMGENLRRFLKLA